MPPAGFGPRRECRTRRPPGTRGRTVEVVCTGWLPTTAGLPSPGPQNDVSDSETAYNKWMIKETVQTL